MASTYLPVHVDRDTIRPCIIDMLMPFTDIESEQQAIEQQSEYGTPFIVLEKDYFTVYSVPGGPLKCDYISRNYITFMARYHSSNPGVWSSLQEQDGLKLYPEPPAVYFIHEKCQNVIIEGWSGCNTALIRYSEKDTRRFAEAARGADGCCNHFFVVYEDGIEQCFDSNNPENSYTVSRFLKFIFLPAVRKDAGAIKRFEEEDWVVEEEQWSKRLPNGEFRLKDADGIEVRDGEAFSLEVICEEEDKYIQEFDDYCLAFFEDELLVYSKNDCDLFTCEMIDGILYLKCNDQYLHCSDDNHNHINPSPELPEPSDRLQISYDGTDILFSRWGTSEFATFEWDDGSSATITIDSDWKDSRSARLLRTRLVKI